MFTRGQPVQGRKGLLTGLMLAGGAVINWAGGDVTLTHSANKLTFAGAASGYVFDAPIDFGTIVAAQEILLYHTGNNCIGLGIAPNELRAFTTDSGANFMTWGKVATSDGTTYTGVMRLDISATPALKPVADGGVALGTTTLQWSNLFLASGGVINWNGAALTVTHSVVGGVNRLTQSNSEFVLLSQRAYFPSGIWFDAPGATNAGTHFLGTLAAGYLNYYHITTADTVFALHGGDGNISIGARGSHSPSFGTSATNTIFLTSGTAPTTSPTGGAQLSTTSGVMRCRDSGGTVMAFGAGLIGSITANVSVISNSFNKLLTTSGKIPANSLQAGDAFRVTIQGSFTGNVSATAFRVYFGPLGTTGDPVIHTASVTGAVGTAEAKLVMEFTFRTIGATGTLAGALVVEQAAGAVGITNQAAVAVIATTTTTAPDTTVDAFFTIGLLTANPGATGTVRTVTIEKI